MSIAALTRSLTRAGKRTEVFQTPDGTRLALLPYGARVLGLYPAGSDENFYWSNPALERTNTARALFAGSGWHNTGGERTWLAPELDIFFRDHPKMEAYWQPRQLDMANYRVSHVDGGVSMSRLMNIHLGRADRDVKLKLSRWFGPAANPLRHERDLGRLLNRVQYAGYTQRTTVEIQGRPAEIGLWNLIQLPPGGELFVPLYRKTIPQVCFGKIPKGYLRINDRMLRFTVRFKGSNKISLRATDVCGRAGYLYARGNCWFLVIRNLFVNPSGEYIDVQKSELGDLGYALQVCRVDEPDYGSFFELEYHAPATGALPNPARSEDTSQIWAFCGSRNAIQMVATKLLGI